MPTDTVLAASSASWAAALIWPFHGTHENCFIFFSNMLVNLSFSPVFA